MKPDEFRALVLQAAIQGKLVPQDPNDEPASLLLDKIRAEKQKLMAEGKIKKSKNDSFIVKRDNHYYENINGKETCIDEELPFDIPVNWMWCRLGDISNYGSNASMSTKDIPEEAYIIELENIEKDTGRIIGKTLRSSLAESSSHFIFFKGDVLYSKLRPYLNKVVIPDIDGFCSGEIMALRFDDSVVPKYMQLYLMSPYFIEYAMSRSYGCKMPRLGTTDGKRALIPMPPQKEQDRIVLKIGELSTLSALHKNLINSTTSLLIDLKASIINNAIQGKLVPQDPNDEPVKIDCKNPIVRRDNSYYEVIEGKEVCIDEEIPFEIPHQWVWFRMESISNYGKNISISTNEIPDDAFVIELENIEKESGHIIGYTDPRSLTETSTHHLFSKGDVLYSKLRPYLNKVVIPDVDGYCSSEIMTLKFNSDILPRYAQLFLMSTCFIEYAMRKSYGCKMPRLGTNDGKRVLIPIPPLNEQKRTVSRIKELLGLLNTLQ